MYGVFFVKNSGDDQSEYKSRSKQSPCRQHSDYASSSRATLIKVPNYSTMGPADLRASMDKPMALR
jgi:hypothetical protein